MGIELFFSNRLENLVEKLDVVINSEYQNKENIFKAPLVIIPSANIAKWIKLQLSRKNGIVMNIEFQYLETGLWNLLESLDPNDEKAIFLELTLRQLLILHVLGNPLNDQPDFKPVNDYLQSPWNQKQPDYSKRFWQLSEKLAFFFQEYEFHRLEMIQDWLKDFPIANTMELCQQKLYMEVKRIRDIYFMKSGNYHLSIMEYSEKVFSEIESKNIIPFQNEYIHIFSFSNISSFHHDLIKKLSRFCSIFIYSINPCEEFWEDITTPWENRWINHKNQRVLQIIENEASEKQLFSEDTSRLLSLWGKSGREGIRMLCQLTDYDFNTCYNYEQNNNTVLGSIQDQILRIQHFKDSSKNIYQDSSLQIIACPSRIREVETVYNSILYNLNQNKNLQLTDIAIQVPDISSYKPFIEAIFNRRPKSVTYNLADAHAEIESLYGKAALKLLELASGRFSRREIFELLLNPCLMQKWGLTIEDIRIFAGWSQALNIFHTFDKASKIKKGYLASDMYTWKQGLVRLKLARIFSGPGDILVEDESSDLSAHRHFHEKTPFSDIFSGDIELLEKFCLVIETLHMYCEQFAEGPYSGENWKLKFMAACNSLFSVPGEINAEKTIQKALSEALDELCLYDRIIKSRSDTTPIELAQFKEFIKSRIGAIQGGYGDYLTSGITISALLPMRPIPFKIIYVLGMQEGNFPGRADNSSLDLRLNRKKRGDISLPERNCYLFLELLLSVRKKLYISYVSKDLQKDRILQPCSVVNQLRRYIESEVLAPDQSFKITHIPLKGNSFKYFTEYATDDPSDVFLNFSTADRIIYYREKGLWSEIIKKASEKEMQSIKSFLPDFSIVPVSAQQPEVFPEKITTRQLGKFLKDPVKHSIQRNMLLYDQGETVEDMTLFEDEPFYGRFPTNYHLKMETLRQWIDHLIVGNEQNFHEKHLEDFFQKTYQKYRLQSLTPEGVYGVLDVETTWLELNQWVKTLKPILIKMLSAQNDLYHALCVGEALDQFTIFSRKLHILNLSEVQISLFTFDKLKNFVPIDVHIHGILPWLWKDHTGAWHSLILTGSGKKPGKRPDRYLIEPVLTCFLVFCLESAHDFFNKYPITFHVAYQNYIREWTFHVTHNDALVYIKKLVSQYLNPHMRQWLPFDAVIDAGGDLGKICTEKDLESFGENFLLKLSADLAETEDPLVLLTNPKIESSIIQEACSRFEIFFKNLTLKADGCE
jgi:exodeoxyribonuclease V gamma subunit